MSIVEQSFLNLDEFTSRFMRQQSKQELGSARGTFLFLTLGLFASLRTLRIMA
jgi:hypothetical protein